VQALPEPGVRVVVPFSDVAVIEQEACGPERRLIITGRDSRLVVRHDATGSMPADAVARRVRRRAAGDPASGPVPGIVHRIRPGTGGARWLPHPAALRLDGPTSAVTDTPPRIGPSSRRNSAIRNRSRASAEPSQPAATTARHQQTSHTRQARPQAERHGGGTAAAIATWAPQPCRRPKPARDEMTIIGIASRLTRRETLLAVTPRELIITSSRRAGRLRQFRTVRALYVPRRSIEGG
jgi:hypothetical protein